MVGPSVDLGAWVVPETLDARAYDPKYGVSDLRTYALGGQLRRELKGLTGSSETGRSGSKGLEVQGASRTITETAEHVWRGLGRAVGRSGGR